MSERANNIQFRLDKFAVRIGARLQGDGRVLVDGVASIENASPGKIAPCLDKKLRARARQSLASALIVPEGMEFGELSAATLFSKNPQMAFAKAMRIFAPRKRYFQGIEPSAHIAASAEVAADVNVGPGAVVGPRAKIASQTTIGENVVIGGDCVLGERCVICAGAIIEREVKLGNDVLVQSGAVIGADGFGFASDGDKWFRIAHAGSARIGNAVAVGPLTTIARGTLDDTVIEDGVVIDAQVLIAHNVYIGENTAIAGGAAIAGSTKIGRRCQIGGGSGIADHLQICDDVVLGGMARVSSSIDKEGYYASHFPLQISAASARASSLIKKLPSLFKRMRALERQLREIEEAAKESSELIGRKAK